MAAFLYAEEFESEWLCFLPFDVRHKLVCFFDELER